MVVRESISQGSGQVWSFQTPFGIVYGTIPREVVDYPSTHIPGTIIVSTSQRRLYYVLGAGKAIRDGIAVGMEGYALVWHQHSCRQPRIACLTPPPPYLH